MMILIRCHFTSNNYKFELIQKMLAGLPSDVKNDEQLNEGCQLDAKYSSKADSLSHSINDYWKETCEFNNEGN